MITQVEFDSPQGDQLVLDLGETDEGYSIHDITGLDPVKATLVSSGYANEDGEQYHSARREKRNIVVKLGYEPDFANTSVRSLRNRLYGFFMPKSPVNLSFTDDELGVVEIAGIVESFDSPLFVQKPEATISILCFDPDFVDPSTDVVAGTTVSDATPMNVNYTGTVETGLIFRMTIDRALSQFSIVNLPEDGEQRTMDFAATLSAGDSIEVNTISGSKGVYLIRGGTRSSLLYSLAAYSDWINLYPGTNAFWVSVAGTAIPYTIEYLTRYGGL